MVGSKLMWHHVEDVELKQDVFLESLFNEPAKLAWIFANDSEVKKPMLAYCHSRLQRTVPVMIASFLDGQEQEIENATHPILKEGAILQPYTNETFSLILEMIRGAVSKSNL
ncbi:hypothetical protein SAMN06295970_13212 [Noviherbaspirillum suwonense]|uniref:Uncharacterized protein n=2 Tax=Noviherbaspirillum suwonense TaxID=1224511 RepID=A0ABY1QSN0_9BURK|nr:hypothetical protein SAMN06295970_13212 [Noviherbaspirillum suwonense]